MKFTAALIITAFVLTVFTAAARENNINSILAMPDDTTKVTALIAESRALSKANNIDSALMINQHALIISDKLNFLSGLESAYNNEHQLLLQQDKSSAALRSLCNSLQKFKDKKYWKGFSYSLRSFAVYYVSRGDYTQALKFGKYCLYFADSASEPIRYLGALNNVGGYYNALGDYDQGMQYLLRAFKIAETANDTFRITTISINIAAQFIFMQNGVKAKEYLYRSIQYQKSSNPSNLYQSYTNLGYIYLMLDIDYDSTLYYYHAAEPLAIAMGDILQLGRIYHNMSEAHMMKGSEDSAIHYAEKALKIALDINNIESIAAAYNSIGLRYKYKAKETGNKYFLNKAKEYFSRALEYAKKSAGFDVKDAYLYMSDIYEATGDYKSAYRYRVSYDTLKYSRMNEDILKNTTELEAKYQAEKKQNEINQLNAEKEISRVTMARQQTINYSLASIAFLILVSSVLIYRNVQKKREVEKQVSTLEKQNAIETMRSKIASDVHDDMGAGLTKMGLYSEQLLKSKIVSENEKQLLEKISLQSKEAIDGMREIIWASNPANDNLKSMLGFMRQYIGRFFDGTDIRPVINFPHDIGDVVLHPEVRRNLFMILKESLNNAVKYSGSDKVDIDFSNENENFNLNIKDYGKGIDDKTKDDFSNGLRNMQMRAQQIQSAFRLVTAPGKGVQIVVEGKLY